MTYVNGLKIDQNKNLMTALESATMAQKITTVGDDTYIALAPAGTAEATAGWRAYKASTSGTTTTITWADGDTNFDNVATDLTALSYS